MPVAFREELEGTEGEWRGRGSLAFRPCIYLVDCNILGARIHIVSLLFKVGFILDSSIFLGSAVGSYSYLQVYMD